MRIVLTHPFCWPYVRRGTERNVHELGCYLRARGHEVFTLSTAQDRRGREDTDAGTRVLVQALWHPALGRVRIEATHAFFLSAAFNLPRLAADVVHSFCFTDALAAQAVRRRGQKTVFQMNGVGVPGVSCHRRFPPDAWLYRTAIHGADARVVCSRFIQMLVREHYGAESLVIPPPVAFNDWPMGSGPRDGRPTFVSLADFNVRRKGVRPLVRAFCRVKEKVRDARLQLVGQMTKDVEREIRQNLPASVSDAIEATGLGKVENVRHVYGEAHVTVLPAMWEPSGAVLLESLACGTPVVATNHGGIPEFFTDGVGVLFPPGTNGEEVTNVDGLADAMLAGLELATTSSIRGRCRSHAEQYGMATLGPQLEQLYTSL